MSRRIEKEELIKLYEKQKKELGRPPKKSEFRHVTALKKFYKSYNYFLRDIGETPYFHRIKEDYIKMIKEIYNRLGRAPTIQEAEKEGLWRLNIYQKFGSWNNFLREANMKTNAEPSKINMTKDELLEYYIKLCNKANKILSQKEIIQVSDVNINVLRNRFTSISKMIDEAQKDERLKVEFDSGHSGRDKYNIEELEKHLRRFIRVGGNGKKEFVEYIKANDLASINTYLNRFGETSFKRLLDRLKGD